MLIARDRAIMGEFCNGRTANILGWSAFTLTAAGALALLAQSVHLS
jgi:Mn2+/Fe2+ NRAMP family transporter